MKKLNVGILILSNTWGGAEESVYNIAKSLDKKDFGVSLLVNDFLFRYYYPFENVNVVNLGQLESDKKMRKIFTILKIQSSLHNAIRKHSIKLIHAQLENSLLTLGTTLRKLSIPVVFTLRGKETSIYHWPKTIEQKIIRMVLNNMFKNNNITVTSVSNWLIKDFKDERRSQIVVTPNGVDCKKFKPLRTKKLENTILYVGRLIKDKGISDLVEIAKELKEYEFLFAGVGPMEKIINLKNTKILGFKTRDELVKLYSKACICVSPSSYPEGMPMVGLESMASGCAVVASNVGFSEYIVSGKDGMLVTPRNIRELKEVIVNLMENRALRKEIGVNAREKALKYTLTRTVKRYQDLYRNVVAK